MDTAYGQPFAYPGAEYSDDTDGTGSISVSSGTVDENTLGTYILEYSYTDVAGNPSNTLIRTVNVIDLTAPTITLIGDNPYEIYQNSIFTDPGAKCSDDVDMSCTVSSTGTVDTATLGSYTLTYDAVDTAGNIASSVTRTVDVIENTSTGDTTPPVVTLSGNSTLTLEASTGSYLDAGASWSDNVDGTGDTLDATFTLSGSVNLLLPGIYTLTYTKVDSSNNQGNATRTITVIDTTAPTLTLSGSNPLTITQGDTFTDDGASWEDIVDGTGFILTATSGSVDTNMVGTYLLTYEYTDARSNTGSTTRTVNVLANTTDTIAPIVNLISSSNLTVTQGSTYTDFGAIWTDNVDGSGTVAASGSVNTGIIGTYILTYRYTDMARNISNIVKRTVLVVSAYVPLVTGPGGGGSSHTISSSFLVPRPLFPVLLTDTGTSIQTGVTLTGTMIAPVVPRIVKKIPTLTKSYSRVTNASALNLRSSKSFTEKNIISILKGGESVRVYYIDANGWALVTTSSGVWGFVRAKYLEKI